MIYAVWSDLEKFKRVDFRPGANILLADVDSAAELLSTRNRAGKSSLVEVIDFVLGASLKRDSALASEAVRDAFFYLDLDIGSTRLTVKRSPAAPTRVVPVSGALGALPAREHTNSAGEAAWHIDTWKALLGEIWFGLASEPDATFRPPSYRQLMSYFVRREAAGGFLDPTKTFTTQPVLEQRLVVSYLLGLDWRLVKRWQEVEASEKRLDHVRELITSGELEGLVRDSAQIRADLAVEERGFADLRAALSEFRILPQYRQAEAEVDELTEQINALSDAMTLDARLVRDYSEALSNEVDVAAADEAVARLYEEAGVVLGENVKRRWDEVRAFHASVVENRRLYLGSEIGSAKRRNEARDRERIRLDVRRADLLRALQGHGAIEQLTAMQSEATRQGAHIEQLREQLRNAEGFERGRVELRLERAQMQLELKQELGERSSVVSQASIRFSEVCGRCYREGGSFAVKDSENGPLFEIAIHGGRSGGVRHMKIFCFDMMMASLRAERAKGPYLLIHDSHVFDGVDENQVRSAVQVGSELAERDGFQYIVTMNSDTLPDELDVPDAILSVRLTDAEDGGLFGFRFD